MNLNETKYTGALNYIFFFSVIKGETTWNDYLDRFNQSNPSGDLQYAKYIVISNLYFKELTDDINKLAEAF